MMTAYDAIVVFILAFLLDWFLGDPPEKVDKYYPIVWISRVMYFFDRRIKRGNPLKERIMGVVCTIIILLMFSVPCLMISFIPSEILRIGMAAAVFKMTFTVKGIERFAVAVVRAGNIEEKRKAVSKIVSRDVSSLENPHLNSATVESVAENFTDSVVSPLFYFVLFSSLGYFSTQFSLFGVFGAMVYRVINTLDAVVGYKTERYRHFGWFAARADDVLNFIPERIAAAFILIAGRFTGRLRMPRYAKSAAQSSAQLSAQSSAISPAQSCSRLSTSPRSSAHSSAVSDVCSIASGAKSHTKHEAPVTIHAMSRVLGVRLEKIGCYTVGYEHELPADEHIEKAVKIVKIASLAFASVCAFCVSLLCLFRFF